MAGSVSDITHPPPSANHPPLNPFTPEWFAQVIGAAATAVATAVANTPHPPPVAHNSSAPRRLNNRKVPHFWEDKPQFWFQIFDAHLAHFQPSERGCFDALLPLLTPAARSMVQPTILQDLEKEVECLLQTSWIGRLRSFGPDQSSTIADLGEDAALNGVVHGNQPRDRFIILFGPGIVPYMYYIISHIYHYYVMDGSSAS